MRDDYSDDDFLDEDEETKTESSAGTRVRSARAWRSIERYREMQELRKHLDDYFFEDLPERQFKDLTL